MYFIDEQNENAQQNLITVNSIIAVYNIPFDDDGGSGGRCFELVSLNFYVSNEQGKGCT